MSILIGGLVLALALPPDAWTGSNVRESADECVGVISSSDRLPPLEGEYHGKSSHIFLGGQAVLTCSNHGTFQGNGEPPKKKGEAVDIAYLATFVGELALTDPASGAMTAYPLDEEIRMVERVTYVERERGARVFDTELVSLSFRGSGFPAGVIARQSAEHRTLGRTIIRRLPQRKFCIETVYQVWMELSLDGGLTWNQQDVPVEMVLMQRPVAPAEETAAADSSGRETQE